MSLGSRLELGDYHQVRQMRQAHGKPFVIAHRGASAIAPENTLYAFERAVQLGAHLIETDLWITRDRKVALLHDRTLERTTGQPGAVHDRELAELQEIPTRMPGLDVPGFHPIPSLSELLELARAHNTGLLLELKDPRFAIPAFTKILIDLLHEHESLSSCLIVSFARACLRAVRQQCPALPIGLVTYRMGLPDRQWDLVGPIYPAFLLNPLFAHMAHQRQVLTTPLDPHPERRVDFYRKIDVDAILANDVAQIVALLDDSPEQTAQTG